MMPLFCPKNDIIHQTSYSTRHNKMVLLDGNIHILDVIRTMMIHMHVLKYL